MADSDVLMGIADQTGTMVLDSKGDILSSTGELENDKKVADAVYSMLLSSQRIVSSVKNDAFRRLSIVMADYQLVVSISDSKVYIAKRPVSA